MSDNTDDRLTHLPEEALHAIANEIASILMGKESYGEMIQNYALRQGRDHLIEGSQDSWSINRKALIDEVVFFLFDILRKSDSTTKIAEAVRRKDTEQLKDRFYFKCISRFAEGARNPRFRAIRTILSDASKTGDLIYRPGRGNSTKGGDAFGSFSFSEDEGLPLLPSSELNKESFADWPYPEFLKTSPKEPEPLFKRKRLTQKSLVLALARLFWEEAANRYGPSFFYLSDLKRFIEHTLPRELLNLYLPDPADEAIITTSMDYLNDGDQEKQCASDMNVSTGLPSDMQPPVFESSRKAVERMVREWFASQKPVRALVFCLMYHCGYGTTKAAQNADLKSPQNADTNNKAALKSLRDFCSRQEGLSVSDLDPEVWKLFSKGLRDFCADNVLKGEC